VNHALTTSLQMPCLVTFLPQVESAQIDADVVGAPSVQSSASLTR